MPWHPTVPIRIPSCFSSLINPLIPVQVSFNGEMGSLERDLKDLTLPRGELICCISWGPCNTFLLHFPLHSDPSLIRITPSSVTGLWGWFFSWGFIWDGQIKHIWPLVRCNDFCLVSQMRAQLEIPKVKVGDPTFSQDFGISRYSSRTGMVYLPFIPR